MRHRIFLLLLCGLLSAPTGQAVEEPWLGVPNGDQMDWLGLTSGEWLAGEIKVFRNDAIEFDSKRMKLRTIKWKYIKYLRTKRHHTAVFYNGERHTGSLSLKEDVLTINDEAGKTVVMSRPDLYAIIPGDDSEWDYWSGKLGFGAAYISGNTSERQVNGNVRIRRRAPWHRTELWYEGVISYVDRAKNSDNHQAQLKHDYFIDRQFFLTPASVTYYRDLFQNIKWRLTPGVGLGYNLLDTKRIEWDVLAGFGWQFTEYDSVPDGQEDETDNGAIILGTTVDTEITSDIDFEIHSNSQFNVDDTADFFHSLSLLLSIDITGDFDLDLGFNWDHTNKPQSASDGIAPAKDDYRTTIGLGYEF